MTDTTRRQFFKRAGQAAGGTLLTAGLPGSSKTKVKTVKKVQKLGPEAKAYRKFLRTLKGEGSNLGRYPKKMEKLPLSTFNRVATQYFGAYKEGREAFKEMTAPKGKGKTYEGRHSAGLADTLHKTSYKEHFLKDDYDYVDEINDREVIEKELKQTARRQLATEKRKVRADKKPKKVTKRGIFEKIKSKVKKVTDKVKGRKIYGGGGGKMPSSGMESAKDPTGMSLLRKYTL
jgi:hypothetical protein